MALGSAGICGEPALEVLWLRANSLAATLLPLSGGGGGGDCAMPIGIGGGGGNVSRPVDMLRPRVGVLAFDVFGVPPPLPLLGGSGGGCVGRGLPRDGVPGAYRLSDDICA